MLVDEMFIETWSSNISYNDFFAQCQPTKCSIILIERLNPLYTFTMITSLYGGLSIILRLISPSMAKVLYRYISKRRQATVSTISSNRT